MTLSVPSGGLAARIAVVVLALLTLALIVRTGLGFTLVQSQPALAAKIDPANGGALAAHAEATMLAARDDDDVAKTERLARAALLLSPLEASALRNVGFVMAVTGREQSAARVLTLAGEASLRDYLTHAWLLNDHLGQGRVSEAIREADIVLRQDVSVWPLVMPELARLLSDPRSIEPMARALAGYPGWRLPFLQSLKGDGDEREANYALLRRLRLLGAAATTIERQPWFATARSVEPTLLFGRWKELLARPLAPEHLLVRDGEFDGLDAPGPFNWSFFPAGEIYAERSTGPDARGGSLYLSFDGTALVNFATQKLVLPAGRYRIDGRAYGDGEVDPGRFAVQLRCGEEGRELDRIDLSPRPDAWNAFGTTVTIPRDCPSQHIWFIGLAAEALAPAAIWIDDVSIRPIG